MCSSPSVPIRSRPPRSPTSPVDTLVALAAHPKCVAIGEAGLDYHYDTVPRDVAARVFRTQIAAARQSGLPLVIHARDADDGHGRHPARRDGAGTLHGRAALLHRSAARSPRRAWSSGLFISFSGVVTFKGSDALRAVARDVPLDRMLVETDAPFLAPLPVPGQAQRAGLCGSYGGGPGRPSRARSAGPRRGDARQHRAALHQDAGPAKRSR